MVYGLRFYEGFFLYVQIIQIDTYYLNIGQKKPKLTYKRLKIERYNSSLLRITYIFYYNNSMVARVSRL